jgi:hypothetical protein
MMEKCKFKFEMVEKINKINGNRVEYFKNEDGEIRK